MPPDDRSGDDCHLSSNSASDADAAPPSSITISRLDLYSLSVVLSFVGDECDGASLLLTNRRYCRTVLPIFELRQQQALKVLQPSSSSAARREGNGGGGGSSSTTDSFQTNNQRPTTTTDGGGPTRNLAKAETTSGEEKSSSERVVDDAADDGSEIGGANHRRRLRKVRHRFRTMPMQDADVLLARLNSRRLRLRNVFLARKARESGVFLSQNNGMPRMGAPPLEEKRHGEVGGDVGNVGKKNGVIVGKRRLRCSYRLNLTTEELAEWEHLQLGLLMPPPNRCDENSINGVDSGQSSFLGAHQDDGQDPDANCPSNIDDEESTMIRFLKSLPPQLELLRFKRGPNEVLPGWDASASSAAEAEDAGSKPSSGGDHNVLNGCSEGGGGCEKGVNRRHDGTSPSRPPPRQLPILPTNERPVATTLLVSYPRSGNSLLRSLVERITGVVTGTDTRPDRTLSRELSTSHDMVGEGVTDVGRVHLIKTHYPERRGWKALGGKHRVILLTRNPFDAIDSYFNMALTNTHTKTVTDEVYEQYRDVFRGMAKSEIVTWKKFHQHWFRSTGASGSSGSSGGGVVNVKVEEKNSAAAAPHDLKKKVPMLVLRYEDLVTSPREAMCRVISFMIGHPITKPSDSLPPFWERRINCVLGGNAPPKENMRGREEVVDDGDGHHSAATKNGLLSYLGSYRPRSGGIGKSLESGRFSPEIIDEMHVVAGDIFCCFGYNVSKQGFPGNMTTNNGKFVMPRRNRAFFNCDDERIDRFMSTVQINAGKELRGPDNQYGRKITAWRKSQTEGDSKPMATIERKDSS